MFSLRKLFKQEQKYLYRFPCIYLILPDTEFPLNLVSSFTWTRALTKDLLLGPTKELLTSYYQNIPSLSTVANSLRRNLNIFGLIESQTF